MLSHGGTRSPKLIALLCAALGLPLAALGDGPAAPKPAAPAVKPAADAPKTPAAGPEKPKETPQAEKLHPVLAAVPAVNDPAVAQSFSHTRTPQQAIAEMQLPPGYHLELVASEPT